MQTFFDDLVSEKDHHQGDEDGECEEEEGTGGDHLQETVLPLQLLHLFEGSDFKLNLLFGEVITVSRVTLFTVNAIAHFH